MVKAHQTYQGRAPVPAGPGRAPLRLFLGAFGDPGHAFPMLALGSALARRGHAVAFESWERWRPHAEAAGMAFVAAPEYPVFPQRGEAPLKPYEAVVRAARDTRPHVAALRPHAVVADILTLGPALAGELEGAPVATLIPHVHPDLPHGAPPYSFGARLPRTAPGRRLWSALDPLVRRGLEHGKRDLNGARARLGLPPVERVHGGISERLCLVGTFPQLEYPRDWTASTHVVGPLLWEPPYEDVEPPPGEDPLVLVAPSTAQDRSHRLLRAALAGLDGEPVRVLATWNRRRLPGPQRVPANARLVEWISYARTMPRCAVVVCHVGHGTMARALASGATVVACPVAGDMAENAARLDWAGAGVRLPWRLATPRGVRLAVRRALAEPALARRAGELAAWARAHDGAERAADLVEELARGGA
ncbi:MAG TPA: nucleotide disphospho-sugar-binding domain-containing protein [Conexibacter sp.]|nr:nucleotide disphospho-sugar-binding domain-containing protein [Conexibacter sp.]